MRDAATTPEPVVTPDAERFMIACPECGCFGTHLQTCSWSFANRGEVWSFFAERLIVRTGAKA